MVTKLTPNTISNETSSSSSHPILPPKNKLFLLFILLLGISLSLLGVLLLQSNPQQDKHIVKADQRGPTQDASNTTGSRAELKNISLAKIKNSKEPSTTEQGIKIPVDQNPPPLKISKPTPKKPRKKPKKHVNIGSIAVKLFPIKPTYKPNETVSIMSKVKSGKISNRWLSVRVGKKVGRYVRGKSIMVSQDWIKIGTIKWTNETNHTKIKVCYAKICGVLKTSVKDLMNIEF